MSWKSERVRQRRVKELMRNSNLPASDTTPKRPTPIERVNFYSLEKVLMTLAALALLSSFATVRFGPDIGLTDSQINLLIVAEAITGLMSSIGTVVHLAMVPRERLE